MADTAIKPSEKRNAAPETGDVLDSAWADSTMAFKDILAPLASLKLTVVLFVLSLFLVFAGTLAQRFDGIWTIVGRYFRSAYVLIPLNIFLPESVEISGSIPFPGGWLLGGLLMINLLAAHAVRFKVSWKRSGILLIHSGIVVMMLSEFVTGVSAIEGNMTIDEGGASNYLEHSHANELAIVDPSDPKTDDVIVIPGKILRRSGLIQHASLPFDVNVVRYMVNSALIGTSDPRASDKNPATAGAGVAEIAIERPEVSGTDPNQIVDIPAAYLTFKKKGSGESLGTYLVSLSLMPQLLAVDDKAYQVSLRFKRTYKPYTLHLIDFKHEVYLGTDKPKNFSSQVRLVDPTRNEDREVKIWMNNPLRHAGETFYQSSFKPDDSGTILQVVRNPGWLLPYISCAMVSGGMLVHFGMNLLEFLRRRIAR